MRTTSKVQTAPPAREPISLSSLIPLRMCSRLEVPFGPVSHLLLEDVLSDSDWMAKSSLKNTAAPAVSEIVTKGNQQREGTNKSILYDSSCLRANKY